MNQSIPAFLWHRRGVILISGFIVALLATIYAFVTPPIYTAKTTMLPRPEESSQNMILGQLVSLAGFSLDQGGVFEALYGRIVISDRILDTTLGRVWIDELEGGEKSLIEILMPNYIEASKGSKAKEAGRFKRYLRQECIAFNRDKSNGFMILKVSLPKRPKLAAELANFLAERLDQYLGEASRSRALDQKRFINNRLVGIESSLAAVEQELSRFEVENRSWSSSPSLSLEHEELEREVRVQSTLWVELKRQLEITKLDEHKDIVRIEVLDPATAPLERSAPQRSLIIILGGLLGCTLAGTGLLVREYGALA